MWWSKFESIFVFSRPKEPTNSRKFSGRIVLRLKSINRHSLRTMTFIITVVYDFNKFQTGSSWFENNFIAIVANNIFLETSLELSISSVEWFLCEFPGQDRQIRSKPRRRNFESGLELQSKPKYFGKKLFSQKKLEWKGSLKRWKGCLECGWTLCFWSYAIEFVRSS